MRGRRDGGGDAVECTAAAVSSPPFRFGRSSLPRAARHTGSSLRWRFFFPASEGAPRSPDAAASAAGWVLTLVARPRRRRPNRSFQPAVAPVAPDESSVLFVGLGGSLGRSVVGWFRVGEEWRSVFPPGSADPMVGVVASCANLCVRLASSSRFDFGSRGGYLAMWTSCSGWCCRWIFWVSGSKKKTMSCKKQIGGSTTWRSKPKNGEERCFFLANSDCEKKTRVARKKQGKRSWQRSWGPTETRKKWRGCTLEGKTEKKLATRRCPAKTRQKWR